MISGISAARWPISRALVFSPRGHPSLSGRFRFLAHWSCAATVDFLLTLDFNQCRHFFTNRGTSTVNVRNSANKLQTLWSHAKRGVCVFDGQLQEWWTWMRFVYIYIHVYFQQNSFATHVHRSILQLSLYNPLLYKSCFSEASNHFMLPGTWTTIRVETPNAPWSSLQVCRTEGPGGLKHSEAKSLNDPMAQNPTPQ